MPSVTERERSDSPTREKGLVWPVVAGTGMLVLLLPVRSGLAMLLHFPSAPPYWELSRAAGLLAFACLWLTAVSGAVSRLPVPAALRPLMLELHQWGAVWAVYAGLFHGAILMWDRSIQFRWRDVLVPFRAPYEPALVGMGTLALYGLVIALLTTYFRTHLSANAWRWLHALSYPAYVLALWHGVALGTDSPLGWVRAFYAGTTGVLILLIVVRLTYQPARAAKGAGIDHQPTINQP